MGRDDVILPREVEALIAEGQTIVVFEEYVLRLDSWLERHPGGRLAILHMVGRDATDEIKVYHAASTLRTMKAFRIGRKPAGLWPNMLPPIRGGVYRKADSTPSSLGDSMPTCPVIVEPAVADYSDDAATDSDSDSSRARGSDDAGRLSPGLDRASLASSVTSDCGSDDEIEIQNAKDLDVSALSGLRKRTVPSSVDGAAVNKGMPPGEWARKLSPLEYTDWAIQQEVEREAAMYPSVDMATQQDIIQKYRALHQKVIDEGHYDCRYTEYGKELVRYTSLFAAFFVALRYEWYITSACFLGLFWHQIMFSAHDAGHRAITHVFWIDTLIALFIADFCCGLSMGWWKSSHNVHHLITNMPEHDPDIQNVPLFATCISYAKSLTSSYYDGFVYVWDKAADIMVPFQKYTYYPVMGIARFNLYLLSWCHVLSKRSSGLGNSKAWWIRPTEIAFMTCYWFLFGYCLVWRSIPTWTMRVIFVLVSHIITMPLHVQITLSHWGMSTVELSDGESFPQRQLRTTMDVDCPAWLDWIHGGLQFQVVHHLFPRVPRHNLRRVQVHVREFCKETGIPYSILSFVDGNKKVIGRLNDVGEQVKMMLNCQKYMAETGESGLH
ncbi:hypothetical protein BN1708_007237 [Verticillium longisporum]|uniref:Delta 8-(E)-sphingolipid desaturase n=1 Tax=Verticillium longisporum TaxID=100787 RepID=A0A0G4MS60_VERLO|nr:hypothetical protein BN1708_007237 [Verticillium longisporum]